jgi:hypothetical protein
MSCDSCLVNDPHFEEINNILGFMWKVKFLCFGWAPRQEGVLEEWKYSSTHSLTSALYGGEWSASHPGRFTPRERARYPLDRIVDGPQSRSGRGGEEKNSQPRQESKPRTPTLQPVAQS